MYIRMEVVPVLLQQHLENLPVVFALVWFAAVFFFVSVLRQTDVCVACLQRTPLSVPIYMFVWGIIRITIGLVCVWVINSSWFFFLKSKLALQRKERI
jgi:hypothetical protein